MIGSNVLVKYDGSLKLADFGLARFKNPSNPRYNNNVVTRWYRAPELILGSETYSEAIDVWAVGCILAEFMDRKPLFPGSDDRDMAQRIFSMLGTPTEASWPGVEKYKLYHSYAPALLRTSRSQLRQHFTTFERHVVLDLLEELLKMDPSKRITAQEALRHPWFTSSPEPDKAAVRLPKEPRNEAWLKRQFAEQQRQQQVQQQQQYNAQNHTKRHPPQRKRSHSDTYENYDTTSTQPPRKQIKSSATSGGSKYRSVDDVPYGKGRPPNHKMR
jgi:serine/threonine protein kinase